jgi:hypothetical protein
MTLYSKTFILGNFYRFWRAMGFRRIDSIVASFKTFRLLRDMR